MVVSDPGSERTQMGAGDQSGRQPRPAVVVVGAGVSGCACAATLAASGVRVTVVNSALDAVGQPGYGPVVEGGAGGWNRIVDILADLPTALRSVWVGASTIAMGVTSFFFVDRRMLSIETKRGLECMPGLEFRQGLVTDLRSTPGESPIRGGPGEDEAGRGRPLVVGTAFGETVEADAVVVAVGLSLDGWVRAGDGVVRGGRYGEVCAGGLQGALGSLGAAFGERSIEVGLSIRQWGSDASGDERYMSGDILRQERDGALRVVETVPLEEMMKAADGGGMTISTRGAAWPAQYPPAAHWMPELRPVASVVTVGGDGVMRACLSPDGAALGEMYLRPGVEGNWDPGDEGRGDAEAADTSVGSRVRHAVTGLVVTNVDAAGRLEDGKRPRLPVWFAGRAGGAADYLESLSSGVRVARDVCKMVRGL